VIDPRPYEAAVEEARAQRASAQARVELADAELARAAQLVDSDWVSHSTYDQRLQGGAQPKRPSGRVSDRRVDVGNLVTGDPGATLLTNIVALDPIYFVFDMNEADFLDYQRAVADGILPSARDHSTAIQVRLPDEEDSEVWPRQGTMDFMDNQVDLNAGTVRARAVLPNADHFILPGQFGRLRLRARPSTRRF
jgi:multidrug efflux pump subunit AcrA (membrane-fusion protein)